MFPDSFTNVRECENLLVCLTRKVLAEHAFAMNYLYLILLVQRVYENHRSSYSKLQSLREKLGADALIVDLREDELQVAAT